MFSVIIPLYNKEYSIRKTIGSVLTQSYPHFEVIVVNDGSTDNSRKVLMNIEDTRIRIIDQENKGVSVARNTGIENSNHNWIAFLDADDLWEPNHLEEVIRMMEMHPTERIFSTSFRYSDGRKIFRYSRKTPVFTIDNYFKESLQERLAWTSVMVIHKECFDGIGKFNPALSRGEDLDLWARLAREYVIVKSCKITAIYEVDSENKLTEIKSEYSKSILSIINLKGLKDYERIYFKKIIFNRLKLNLLTLDLNEVLKILRVHKFELFK